MAVSRRLRFAILHRDNQTCRYCGARAPEARLTVDHVIPTALGGTDDPSNLAAACQDCNSGKSSVPLDAPVVAEISAHAAAWDRARAEALDEVRGEELHSTEHHEAFAAAWNTWGYGEPRRTVPMAPMWGRTVTAWLRCGLTVERDLVPMIEIAMRKEGLEHGHDDRWRYFCGVVWRTLDKVDERARAHLAASTHNATSDATYDLTAYEEGFEDGSAYEASYSARRELAAYEAGYADGLRRAEDEAEERASEAAAVAERRAASDAPPAWATEPAPLRDGLIRLLGADGES